MSRSPRVLLRRASSDQLVDGFLVLVAAILFAVAWPTLQVTLQVPAPIQPIVAALAAFPILLLRANPSLGWAISAGSALVIALAFANQPDNDLPWQVVHFLVILPLLFAVSLRAPIPVVSVAWIATSLLFAGYMPEAAKIGWLVGLGALVLFGLLIRWLVLSRRQLARQEQANELERTRRTILEEKARIARDLHDVVAHHMSLVVVQAQSAPYRLADVSPAASAEFESIGATAREALNEIRGMLGVLRSDGVAAAAMPQPGTAQVGELLDGARRAGVRVDARVTGIASAVPEPVGLAVYRILQESLANAGRHAPGAPVQVRIDYGTAVVEMFVTNDGAGSNGQHAETGGHGIIGMRDRAISVGGLLDAHPRADGGFEVAARLPLSWTHPVSDPATLA